MWGSETCKAGLAFWEFYLLLLSVRYSIMAMVGFYMGSPLDCAHG